MAGGERTSNGEAEVARVCVCGCDGARSAMISSD